MKLFYSRTSPFARKVLVCVKEYQLEKTVHLEILHPIRDSDVLRPVNPLCKVPALLTENKELIIDSPIICRYLDDLLLSSDHAQSLVSPKSLSTSNVAQLEAFADGIMATGYLNVMENLRPVANQSAMWKERWTTAIQCTLDYLEQNSLSAIEKKEHHLGQVAIACALGYLDFRMDHLNWRNRTPRLADWFANYEQREPFKSTTPVE